jgi:hypothetical protein
MNITLGDIQNATDDETTMCKTALGYLFRVLASDSFKTKVLAAQFTETNGQTNQQIYDAYTTTTIVINVSFFSGTLIQDKIEHTEGYECGDGYCHINRDFIRTAYETTSIMAHEIGHEPLGFSHIDPPEDQTSIPYLMNSIVEACMDEIGILDE